MNDLFDANITHAFYFSSTVLKTESAFISAVKTKYPFALEYDYDVSYTQPHIRDLQTVQRFLHGGAQTYRVKRFFLDELHPDLEKMGFTGWCVMLSYFPETDVISISFHYGIADVTADQLIVLRQSGANRAYPFPQEEISCSDLAQKICNNISAGSMLTEQSYLCEITKFCGYDTIRQIEEEQTNLLYGLITGDEAYQFVPEKIAHDRLKYNWGSRSFIRVYAFGQAIVFLNLLGSPEQLAYLKHQEAFGTAAYGGCDDYFHLGSCPLTVNHGILLSVEFVMMLKALINDVISYQGNFGSKGKGSFHSRIHATRIFRKRIIMALEKAEGLAISEIGELDTVLLESQHIAPIIDRVKYLLELLESDLDLMYSERNNALVTFLTVLGLVFALIQIILPIIGL